MKKIKLIYPQFQVLESEGILSSKISNLINLYEFEKGKPTSPAYEMIKKKITELLAKEGYDYNNMSDNEILQATLKINDEFKKLEKIEELLKPYENILSSTIKLSIYNITPYTKRLSLIKKYLIDFLHENNKIYDELSPEEIVRFVLKKNEEQRIIDHGYKFEGKDKNIIKLDNGKYIYFDFGKYSPNLNFLIDDLAKGVTYEENHELNKSLNLNYTGDISFMLGKFFVSKKGSNFFDLTTEDKPHVLVKIQWGGSFNQSRGLKDIPTDNLYYRRAKSNGGGYGYDYLILPVNHVSKYSLDDF